jgi:hypothetical protein
MLLRNLFSGAFVLAAVGVEAAENKTYEYM